MKIYGLVFHDNGKVYNFKSQEEFNNLISAGCIIINAVGTCNLNVWNGNFNPQIIIEEYDIVHKLTYYF